MQYFLPFAIFLQAVFIDSITGIVGTTPVIKSIPVVIRVKEHETVLLPCYVDDLGENHLIWWKGDVMIAEDKNTLTANYVVYPNNTLEITDVSTADTGQYTCRVTRPSPWGPIQQHHAVEVLHPPRLNMTPTGELEVELGKEVTISCFVQGLPKPDINWFFKGDEIKLLSSRNVLRFAANRGALSGEYSCMATNGIGESTSSSVYVRVIYPPRVSIERMWINSSPGMRAEVTCDIDGSPLPEVEWQLDHVPVTYNHRVHKSRSGIRHSLVINRANQGDFGMYKCIASNKLGSAFQVVQLSATPSMAEFKTTQQEKFHDRATLAWEVDSYSPVNQYKLLFRKVKARDVPDNWTRIFVPGDGSSIGPIHTQMFSLTGLTSSTMYEAAVLSRNRYGWSRPSNVYRFTTLGHDQETVVTTEGNLIEQITLNELFPDLVADTQEFTRGGYQPSSSVRAALPSFFVIVSLVLRSLRLPDL
ncbi:Immunoglobulin I-set domain [Nesidiocoris tenuis]|uniref:Immunoglobulin I-set domain n=1 Tax=Nesidiocoris tenuis TaxID=355587 RepID=A0ABN7A9T9_9HEMI|nr:Immunoglobulin I-set domain [Nesidiocoris tenuis]